MRQCFFENKVPKFIRSMAGKNDVTMVAQTCHVNLHIYRLKRHTRGKLPSPNQ